MIPYDKMIYSVARWAYEYMTFCSVAETLRYSFFFKSLNWNLE